MLKIFQTIFAACSLLTSTLALADLTVPVYFTTENQTGKQAGTITITQTKYGLVFTPDLHGLTPGIHGFHVHEKPSCEENGMAAGGHLDPQGSNQHHGPYSTHGHLGDLPAIVVLADGTATLAVLAPRLNHEDELRNHTLMLHEGGDNYADQPTKLGGGGTRMVCGIIK